MTLTLIYRSQAPGHRSIAGSVQNETNSLDHKFVPSAGSCAVL